MIHPSFMTGLLCTAFLVGCGSVNTYKATVGESDGKVAYTSQINDVLSSLFLRPKRYVSLEPTVVPIRFR
jgi:hypothetical protein